jgi:hypothetical protein
LAPAEPIGVAPGLRFVANRHRPSPICALLVIQSVRTTAPGTKRTSAPVPHRQRDRTFTRLRLGTAIDSLRTILRLGHVADGAIVPTAYDGRNRFGKFSAPVGSRSRKRTFLRMTPSFHWTATDLCTDRFADPIPVEGDTLVKRRHMTVSVVS